MDAFDKSALKQNCSHLFSKDKILLLGDNKTKLFDFSQTDILLQEKDLFKFKNSTLPKTKTQLAMDYLYSIVGIKNKTIIYN